MTFHIHTRDAVKKLRKKYKSKNADRLFMGTKLKVNQKALLRERTNKELGEVGMQLSAFQRRMAQYYISNGGDRALAAIQAGSNSDTPEQVFNNIYSKKEEFKQYIALMQAEVAKSAAIDVSECATMFREVYEMAVEQENLKEANVAARNLADLGGHLKQAPKSATQVNVNTQTEEKVDRGSELDADIESIQAMLTTVADTESTE